MVSSLPTDARPRLLSLGLGFWGSTPLLIVTEVSLQNSHPIFRYHIWPCFVSIEGLAFFWVIEGSTGVWERSMRASP